MPRTGGSCRPLLVAAVTSVVVLGGWAPVAYAMDVPEPDRLADVIEPTIDAVSDASEPIADAVSDVSEPVVGPVVETVNGAAAPVEDTISSVAESVSEAGATRSEDPAPDVKADGRSKGREAGSGGGTAGPTSEQRGSDPILRSSEAGAADRAAMGPAPSVDRCAGGALLCMLTFEVDDLGGLLGTVESFVTYLAGTGLMVLPWVAASFAFGLLGAVTLIASRRWLVPRHAS